MTHPESKQSSSKWYCYGCGWKQDDADQSDRKTRPMYCKCDSDHGVCKACYDRHGGAIKWNVLSHKPSDYKHHVLAYNPITPELAKKENDRRSALLDAALNGGWTNGVKVHPNITIFDVAKFQSQQQEKEEKGDAAGKTNERSCMVCAVACTTFCMGCRTAYYCSAEHQKRDWKFHKLLCKSLGKQTSQASTSSASSSSSSSSESGTEASSK